MDMGLHALGCHGPESFQRAAGQFQSRLARRLIYNPHILEKHPATNAGAKSLGEVSMAGVAPAIANAVFHATGRRLRDLPIRIEHLL